MPSRSSSEVPITKITYNPLTNQWGKHDFSAKKNRGFIENFSHNWDRIVNSLNQYMPDVSMEAAAIHLGNKSPIYKAVKMQSNAKGFRGSNFLYGGPKYKTGPNKGKRVSYEDLPKYSSFFGGGSYRPKKSHITKTKVNKRAKKIATLLGSGAYVTGFNLRGGGAPMLMVPPPLPPRNNVAAAVKAVLGPMRSGRTGRSSAPYSKKRSTKHLRLFPLD